MKLFMPNLVYFEPKAFEYPFGKELYEKFTKDEEKRKYKWERCGIGKYVYQKDDAVRLEEKIRGYIHKSFPNAEIQYFT
ncbi:hypothetical protein CON65_04530 [Bacillus pseudomycoides]|uniref:Spore photoproduct lyase n=1 Tax=Bacillus pseudomycoides TaxID=64104 RepID=A0AA91VF27_9BACI|nr:hypothetical protein COO03_09035 [Bacillus sp. AFS098217]PED83834.1 hypothetical protein CON65_04530 [Bacillus pseudomycoides]PEU14696.1 hypothetical protein CN524_08365 [Bacillus sp. AFS019443]PEU19551.1 hypothetical protein CN525_07405 [Bacillus sp. AFS014408]PFW64367.1 hypothetical protein COL20_04305 [Bacillus sp. AFS075034]